ncbi:hypothetical protein Tco_0575641 [Tanacetum coccineum]
MLTRMQDFSKVPDTKDIIKFKVDIQEITYTMDMFCNTLHLLVEAPDNPFIALVNIKVIESIMQRVGYQGVFDKKKDAIQHDKDYHSIKDDIPLVSVYSTWKVLFRGMLIPDAFLTDVIRATNDYKEYETSSGEDDEASFWRNKFTMKIAQNEEEIENMVEGEEEKEESYASEFADSMLNDDDDFRNRIEPGSHKEDSKHVNEDDDETKKEKKDDIKYDTKNDDVEKTDDDAKEKDNDNHNDHTLVGIHATGSNGD